MCARSISFPKPTAGLLAALLLILVLSTPALAWQDGDAVGTVGSLTASNTGNGSLTDDSGLGIAAADAAAYACGAELAVLCGGDLAGNLPPGSITWEQLRFAFREDRPLAVCSVSAPELKALMEFCLSRLTVDERTLSIDREASAFEAFPQISGFHVRCDVSAPSGERVLEITLEDGTSLDLADETARWSLAGTEHLLSGGYGPTGLDIVYTPAGITECEALAEYIAAGRMGDYTEAGRVQVIGSTDSALVKQLGIDRLLLAVCIVAALVLGLRFRAKNAQREDGAPLAR